MSNQREVPPMTGRRLVGDFTLDGISKAVGKKKSSQDTEYLKSEVPPLHSSTGINSNMVSKYCSSILNRPSTSGSSGYEIDSDPIIQKKYQIIKLIGQGAYGSISEAKEKSTGKTIALKTMFDAFCNSINAQKAYREIFYLKKFKGHSNIIELINAHPASNDMDFYLTFQLMATNLHKLITMQPDTLTRAKIRDIVYQILKGINYIHAGNVIHRNLKPSNILADEQLNVKIADFGFARSMSGDEDRHQNTLMMEYINDRAYRAPEILMNCLQQTKGVDMWAIGCILSEMFTKKTLFVGSNPFEQVEIILGKIKSPTIEDIENLTKGTKFGYLAQKSIEKRKDCIAKEFQPYGLPAITLIEGLLKFHPNNRLSAEKSICHPYFDRYQTPNEYEQLFVFSSMKPDYSENTLFTLDEYRSRIFEQIKYKTFEQKNVAAASATKSELAIGSIKTTGLNNNPILKEEDYTLESIPAPILSPSTALGAKNLLAAKKLISYPTETDPIPSKHFLMRKDDKLEKFTGCSKNYGFQWDAPELATHKVRRIKKEIPPTTRPSTSQSQVGIKPGNHSSDHLIPSIRKPLTLPPINPQDLESEPPVSPAKINELKKKLGIGQPFVKYSREEPGRPGYWYLDDERRPKTSSVVPELNKLKLNDSNVPRTYFAEPLVPKKKVLGNEFLNSIAQNQRTGQSQSCMKKSQF